MDWRRQLLLWILSKLETRTPRNPHELRQGRRRLLREDIERLIKINGGPGGLDLTNCDLSKLDLRGMHLRGAHLADSHFYMTDLSGSRLGNCDLRQAHFHDTKLDYVDFYLANLENAHLIGASLIKANLNRANLLNTRLPDRIREAIGDRLLQEDEAEYDRYLNEIARFVSESSIAHRRGLRFIEAANIYAALKNNLMSNGRYDEASWAYIRERQMRRKAFAPWRAMKIYSVLEPSSTTWVGSAFSFWVKSIVQWISDWLAELSCGYGERPLRTLGWAVAIILVFAFVYRWTGGVVSSGGQITWLDYFNYSLGAFTTMGYSQFQAITPLTQTMTSIEALSGIAILALLMFALGNRISRS